MITIKRISANRASWSVALIGAFLLVGCERSDTGHGKNAAGQPVVYTSVAPLAHLVRMLAGDRVDVRALVGPGQDPHSFSPQPRQLIDLGNAAVFFTVGMPYEETLVSKLSSTARKLKIVDVTSGIEKLEMDHDHHHHDHGHAHGDSKAEEEISDPSGHEPEKEEAAGSHDNEGGDPHVWLSPKLLAQQADLVTHVLEEIDPGHEKEYHDSLEAVQAEIAAVDRELTEKLAPMKEQSFYAYHGAFGYFAEAFQLWQESIEVGGRSPSPKRVVELIQKAKEDNVRVIFVQPQFDQKSAQTIAEAIGGTVVAIDPLEEDVLANLRRLGDEIGKALGE